VPFIVSVRLAAFSLYIFLPAMSWSAFTDLVMQGDHKKTGGVHGCAIYGHDGAKWHETDNLSLQSGEMDAILAGLKDVSKFQEKGVHVGGVKYMYVNKIDERVIGKKGQTNVVLRMTKKGVIIAVLKEGISPGNVTMVDFVADDLIKKSL